MDGSDDCTTTWLCLIPQNRTFKNGKDSKICYVYFATMKKRRKKVLCGWPWTLLIHSGNLLLIRSMGRFFPENNPNDFTKQRKKENKEYLRQWWTGIQEKFLIFHVIDKVHTWIIDLNINYFHSENIKVIKKLHFIKSIQRVF